MFRLTTLFLVLVTVLFGANGQQPYPYIATTGNVSLSTQTTAATLQLPATGGFHVSFPPSPSTGASVYCSAACVFSVILNATGATATAGTVNIAQGDCPTPAIKFWTSSNYSGGTTLVTYNVAAGQTFTLDMGQLYLAGGGVNSNITIAIASVTATVNITFNPLEWH